MRVEPVEFNLAINPSWTPPNRVWTAPVVTGKSDELVVPAIYTFRDESSTIDGPVAIGVPTSSTLPPRNAEYTIALLSALSFVTKVSIPPAGEPDFPGKTTELVVPAT